MEVHSPEDGIHSWRDFFVHMGTIVLGLLIALGLEQSVEWLHHRHQRQQLEENLRGEASRNVDILTTHLDVNIPNLLWTRTALKMVHDATVKDGFVDLKLPPQTPNAVSKPLWSPERTVWQVAHSSGTSVLLPEERAQIYARVDFEAEEDAKEVDLIRAATAEMTRFELKTDTRIIPGATLHLTPTEREELVNALASQAQQLYSLLRRDNIYLLDCQGVVQGISNVRELLTWESKQTLRMSAYQSSSAGR